jgi:hypothetical protein
VTTIGQAAFAGCTKLTSVTLPDTLVINPATISGCTGLTSITIPASVTTICSGAFNGYTSLLSVTFAGTIIAANFDTSAFPGDLHTKYAVGGTGVYKRPSGESTWEKQV